MGGTIDVESELGQGSCFEVLMRSESCRKPISFSGITGRKRGVG